MKLLKNNPNEVIIQNKEGVKFLFSYLTLVAIIDETGEEVRTKVKYSRSTTKHINSFLSGSPGVTMLDQTELEQLF